MKNSFDNHLVNHAIVALSLEMNPKGYTAESDALILGGERLTVADHASLVRLATTKNYNLIFASFAFPCLDVQPISYDAVITDGETRSMVLSGGRLWKQDRRTPAMLIFPDAGESVKISRKGRLVATGMKAQYHDHGFDLAREAVAARSARSPGQVPVVSQIGGIKVIFDTGTLARTFAAA